MEGITFVGLDAHKQWISVATLLPGREITIDWQVPNQAAVLRKMLRRIEQEAPGEVRFCMRPDPAATPCSARSRPGARRAAWWWRRP